jgi:HEAT repeat protein
MIHNLFFLLIPLAGVICIILIAFLITKPLALRAYLRAVKAAQEGYHKLYIPYVVLPEPDQDTHRLILGPAGAGKTMLLQRYAASAAQNRRGIVRGSDKIPVYIPLKDYNLYLKSHQQLILPSDTVRANALHPSQSNRPSVRRKSLSNSVRTLSLINFLRESDLPGTHHIRRYLRKLIIQGRIIFLCDGLDEIDPHYLDAVCTELAYLLNSTNNHLIITCREVDYQTQPSLKDLIDEGRFEYTLLQPLQPGQIREFVEHYIPEQNGQWQHTAGQIMDIIDHSRLYDLCTNPMLLFTFMEIIDSIGIQQTKQIDTRGQLLHAYVMHLIDRQRQQSGEALTESALLSFLGEIASAARWANDRNAIKLRISPVESKTATASQREELVEAVQVWLDEHPPQGPFVADDEDEDKQYDLATIPQLMQFAQRAGLINVSPNGIVSFYHELIAAYLIAAHFSSEDSRQQLVFSFREELMADASRWSDVIAIWAGVLDDPMLLAERLATWGRNNPAYLLEALGLSLVCIGVLWTPPQSEQQQHIVLSTNIKEALAGVLRNIEAREKLARLITRCAEEGGEEIYRALFPLLALEGIDTLLVLLDEMVVPDMLFNQLVAIIDDAAYDAQVKRIIQVLGQMGNAVVPNAAEWSQPDPGRTLRLRAAMVTILGRTNDQSAVDPLLARLSDPEPFIRGRALNALIRLGPDNTVSLLIEELVQHAQDHDPQQIINHALLTILERFLNERDTWRITPEQLQHILETLLSVHSSAYPAEIQQKALEILVRQADASAGSPTAPMPSIKTTDTSSSPVGVDSSRPTPIHRPSTNTLPETSTKATNANNLEVLEMLVRNLASDNEEIRQSVVRTLQIIGPVATPLLLAQLEQESSENVRLHIIEILAGMPVLDQRALPYLLHLLADPSTVVQQRAANALLTYAPDSIPGLIELVLFDADESVATRATHILGDIGTPVVGPITQALSQVVPGRTRLLVHVLERVRDPRAIPALIALLQTPDIEPLLAIAIIHALCQNPDTQVVPPLLTILSSSNLQVCEEAVNALSYLGEVAVPGLIAALDVEQETITTPSVRRALLGIVPFPGEHLIATLADASEAQAEQIVTVLVLKGSDAAQVLVTHLTHHDEDVQGYVRHTLTHMEGNVVVPALLEVIHQPSLRPSAEELLRLYKEEAIPQLVGLLGNSDRGEAAASILLELGPTVIPSLVSGLDNPNSAAKERAQQIIVDLARRSPDALSQVVHLFSLSLPPRAYEALLDVLTDELADVSISALLEGLENVYLIEGASDAFVRLVQKRNTQSDNALQSLLAALGIEERRHGAKIVLVNIGELAVPSLINLIADPNQSLAQAAQEILRDIGVVTFPAIWAASNDISNRPRREAALSTFRSMPTIEIKDGLIEHLLSDELEDISMALGLLLERIVSEAMLSRTDQEMIRALLEHVQTQNDDHTTRRIIALLLLVGGSDVANHIAWGLYHYHDQPGHQEKLTQAFLLLGNVAEEVLLEMLRYRATPPELLCEVVGVLGMMAPHQEVYEYTKAVGNPGITMYQTSMTYPERQAVALRALGGLLAGGHLDRTTLQTRLAHSLYGSPEHELYSILLGKPYGPLITKLENDLRTAQYEHEKDRRQFVIQLAMMKHEQEQLEEEVRQLEAEKDQLEAANRRLQERLRQESQA